MSRHVFARELIRRRTHGQALVEFSIVLIPFLFLLMGVVDLGRGIYTNNALSQASREVARVTSVHPCAVNLPCAIGSTPQTLTVIGVQTVLTPGLTNVVIECVDLADIVLAATDCRASGHPGGVFVRVTAHAPFQMMTPLLGFIVPKMLSSVSHVQLQ